VVDIKYEKGRKIVVLKGICYRLEADAPETDLIVQPDSYVRNTMQESTGRLMKIEKPERVTYA